MQCGLAVGIRQCGVGTVQEQSAYEIRLVLNHGVTQSSGTALALTHIRISALLQEKFRDPGVAGEHSEHEGRAAVGIRVVGICARREELLDGGPVSVKDGGNEVLGCVKAGSDKVEDRYQHDPERPEHAHRVTPGRAY